MEDQSEDGSRLQDLSVYRRSQGLWLTLARGCGDCGCGAMEGGAKTVSILYGFTSR